MGNDEPQHETSPASLPVARVVPQRPGWLARLGSSYMWVLALVCLLCSIGLVWWSMPRQGIEITIRFPEGHGLEAEDVLRYRGIDVGEVEKVTLSSDLSGVDVTVNLKPFAAPIAREGSRFWIVRPEFRLGEISGLETAVGHKYIGVLPGDPEGEWQTIFEGMDRTPPDASNRPGTEVILRGERRFGINPGSPLSYRGVEIGRVLDVGLANDGRFVDCRVKIFAPFEYLVTSRSQFWATSGIGLDLNWGSGVKVDIDSLETIARGGVSILTTEPGGNPIRPGQLFPLFGSSEQEWWEQARQVSVTRKQNLRAAIPVLARWQQKGLLGTKDYRRRCVGFQLETSQGIRVAVPSEFIQLPEKAVEGSFQVEIDGQAPLTELPNGTGPLTLLPKTGGARGARPFRESETRVRSADESCLAVRTDGEQPPTYLHLAIDQAEIREDGTLINFVGDEEVWQGAPVLSNADGKLVGFLDVQEGSARILGTEEWQIEW